MMASNSNTPHWEAPKFTFSTHNQADEWKIFYTYTFDFLRALAIGT